MLPSGRVTVLASRAHWARTYLSKAGLLTSPKRNLHVITESGRAFLGSRPERISLSVLGQFPGFDEWRHMSRSQDNAHILDATGGPGSAKTPEDAMGEASALLEAALSDDLLAILRDISPTRFERLILDLLTAMGYGGGDLANARMTKASGDGGIDGIIHEDALGLDAVFVQAKRYSPENKVSRPAIQQFIGSLTGEGATKGVFVTTSDFSADARAFLGKVQQRVVLINGQELARLMIRYGIGVRARTTYVINGLDSDYFSDDMG